MKNIRYENCIKDLLVTGNISNMAIKKGNALFKSHDINRSIQDGIKQWKA
jgi:hypothetical protein